MTYLTKSLIFAKKYGILCFDKNFNLYFSLLHIVFENASSLHSVMFIFYVETEIALSVLVITFSYSHVTTSNSTKLDAFALFV